MKEGQGIIQQNTRDREFIDRITTRSSNIPINYNARASTSYEPLTRKRYTEAMNEMSRAYKDNLANFRATNPHLYKRYEDVFTTLSTRMKGKIIEEVFHGDSAAFETTNHVVRDRLYKEKFREFVSDPEIMALILFAVEVEDSITGGKFSDLICRYGIENIRLVASGDDNKLIRSFFPEDVLQGKVITFAKIAAIIGIVALVVGMGTGVGVIVQQHVSDKKAKREAKETEMKNLARFNDTLRMDYEALKRRARFKAPEVKIIDNYKTLSEKCSALQIELGKKAQDINHNSVKYLAGELIDVCEDLDITLSPVFSNIQNGSSVPQNIESLKKGLAPLQKDIVDPVYMKLLQDLLKTNEIFHYVFTVLDKNDRDIPDPIAGVLRRYITRAYNIIDGYIKTITEEKSLSDLERQQLNDFLDGIIGHFFDYQRLFEKDGKEAANAIYITMIHEMNVSLDKVRSYIEDEDNLVKLTSIPKKIKPRQRIDKSVQSNNQQQNNPSNFSIGYEEKSNISLEGDGAIGQQSQSGIGQQQSADINIRNSGSDNQNDIQGGNQKAQGNNQKIQGSRSRLTPITPSANQQAPSLVNSRQINNKMMHNALENVYLGVVRVEKALALVEQTHFFPEEIKQLYDFIKATQGKLLTLTNKILTKYEKDGIYILEDIQELHKYITDFSDKLPELLLTLDPNVSPGQQLLKEAVELGQVEINHYKSNYIYPNSVVQQQKNPSQGLSVSQQGAGNSLNNRRQGNSGSYTGSQLESSLNIETSNTGLWRNKRFPIPISPASTLSNLWSLIQNASIDLTTIRQASDEPSTVNTKPHNVTYDIEMRGDLKTLYDNLLSSAATLDEDRKHNSYNAHDARTYRIMADSQRELAKSIKNVIDRYDKEKAFFKKDIDSLYYLINNYHGKLEVFLSTLRPFYGNDNKTKHYTFVTTGVLYRTFDRYIDIYINTDTLQPKHPTTPEENKLQGVNTTRNVIFNNQQTPNTASQQQSINTNMRINNQPSGTILTNSHANRQTPGVASQQNAEMLRQQQERNYDMCVSLNSLNRFLYMFGDALKALTDLPQFPRDQRKQYDFINKVIMELTKSISDLSNIFTSTNGAVPQADIDKTHKLLIEFDDIFKNFFATLPPSFSTDSLRSNKVIPQIKKAIGDHIKTYISSRNPSLQARTAQQKNNNARRDMLISIMENLQRNRDSLNLIIINRYRFPENVKQLHAAVSQIQQESQELIGSILEKYEEYGVYLQTDNGILNEKMIQLYRKLQELPPTVEEIGTHSWQEEYLVLNLNSSTENLQQLIDRYLVVYAPTSQWHIFRNNVKTPRNIESNALRLPEQNNPAGAGMQPGSQFVNNSDAHLLLPVASPHVQQQDNAIRRDKLSQIFMKLRLWGVALDNKARKGDFKTPEQVQLYNSTRVAQQELRELLLSVLNKYNNQKVFTTADVDKLNAAIIGFSGNSLIMPGLREVMNDYIATYIPVSQWQNIPSVANQNSQNSGTKDVLAEVISGLVFPGIPFSNSNTANLKDNRLLADRHGIHESIEQPRLY